MNWSLKKAAETGWPRRASVCSRCGLVPSFPSGPKPSWGDSHVRDDRAETRATGSSRGTWPWNTRHVQDQQEDQVPCCLRAAGGPSEEMKRHPETTGLNPENKSLHLVISVTQTGPDWWVISPQRRAARITWLLGSLPTVTLVLPFPSLLPSPTPDRSNQTVGL